VNLVESSPNGSFLLEGSSSHASHANGPFVESEEQGADNLHFERQDCATIAGNPIDHKDQVLAVLFFCVPVFVLTDWQQIASIGLEIIQRQLPVCDVEDDVAVSLGAIQKVRTVRLGIHGIEIIEVFDI